jgi:hypothetical protein
MHFCIMAEMPHHGISAHPSTRSCCQLAIAHTPPTSSCPDRMPLPTIANLVSRILCRTHHISPHLHFHIVGLWRVRVLHILTCWDLCGLRHGCHHRLSLSTDLTCHQQQVQHRLRVLLPSGCFRRAGSSSLLRPLSVHACLFMDA